MKKVIALILSMFLVLSLTACSGQSTESVGKADTDTSQSEQIEQTDTIPDEVETSDELDDEIVYLVDVPVPQMTGDDDHYAENIDAPYMAEYQTSYRVEDDRAVGELETYLTALEATGFTFDVTQFEKTDEDYVYYARATKNNAYININFDWHASDLKSEGDLVIRNASFRVFIDVGDVGEKPQSLDEIAAQLPELPEGTWERSDSEDENWVRCEFYCSQLTLADAESYADVLENAGFDHNVMRSKDDGEFTFEGYASGSPLTMITILRGEDYAFIILQIAKN